MLVTIVLLTGCGKKKIIVDTIVDKTTEMESFNCNQMLERFYEDDTYEYFYSCVKSTYVVVKYSDGTEQEVREALKDGKITIKDLDKYNISYYKQERGE